MQHDLFQEKSTHSGTTCHVHRRRQAGDVVVAKPERDLCPAANSGNLSSHQLINQTSGDVEYYTPIEIVEAARRVMGMIDLDPASSDNANQVVKAVHIYTAKEDGLLQPWHGRIWMNHPFGLVQNPKWINKLEREYLERRTIAACCITYACTSERWFQPLMKRPQCYLTPRTNYRLPDGTIKKGVSKGSVVTYFGGNVEAFAEEYSPFGAIKVEYR